MYVIQGGYAEVAPLDYKKMDVVRKEMELAESRIKNLTVGFEVCAVTGNTQTTGGYRETHLPVCPKETAKMAEELETTKDQMLRALSKTEFPPEVIRLAL